MKVRIVKTCWYEQKYYEPELMNDSELIIDYPCDDVKKLPSWAEPVGNKKVATKPKEDNGNDEGNDDKIKVNELPVVEKNALLEEAKAVGIDGNQILGWKASTLKAKIAAKKAEVKEEDNGNDEGNDE